MDDNLKELLAQKKAHLKEKQKSADIQRYKDHFMKNIEQFSQKYRYADEVETRKIETFLSKLNFVRPGQLAIQDICPYPHENVYLCFLMGPDALFQIYIYGKYADYLSLILEDFSQRIQEKNDLTKKETGYKLFEHLISRVKTPESMVEKCQRKGFEISTESALRQIRDSIGLRIVCGFVDDISRPKYMKRATTAARITITAANIIFIHSCDTASTGFVPFFLPAIYNLFSIDVFKNNPASVILY